MQFDHVIYATRDLDAAARRIEHELALPVRPGGRHDGIGTHNRIVPLGGGYLELMAVADPAEAEQSELGTALLRRIEADAEGLMAWSLAVTDIEAVAARIGSSIHAISREGLTGRLTGVLESLRDPQLPLFISRDAGVADPGGGSDAGGITWIEVGGDAARIEAWVDESDPRVRVVAGAPSGVRAIGIGEREFRPG